MTVQEAIYVQCDDWDGLYIDRNLVGEGDSMNLTYLLDGKTVEFTVQSASEGLQNYIDNVGGYPETWDGVLDAEMMWEEDNR